MRCQDTSFGLAALGRSTLGRNSLVLAEVMRQASLVASDVVWWPAGPKASRDSASALIVSYNTRELTAFLLTGNNHHLEGSNQLPPAARLRGLRVTCLKYGE